MKLLIDTHFVFWYALGDKRLPPKLLDLIADPDNDIYISEASVLEVVIKHAKNPKAMPYDGDEFVDLCNRANFATLPITLKDILAYGTLDLKAAEGRHRDPFDRLLIAQSKAQTILLATHDEAFALYGEPLTTVFA